MSLDFFSNDRYRVLSCMAERQIKVKDNLIIPLSQTDIANEVNLSKVKVNNIISELKENGYIVQQSPRGKYLLTDKGNEAIKNMSVEGK